VDSKHAIYLGIDVQAAHKPFYYTALDADLETIACGHGRQADVLAFLAGQTSALVAINGPVWAPEFASHISQRGLFGEKESSYTYTHRDVDIEMNARGYPMTVVPPAGKKTPVWMERCLELVSLMKRMGYQPYIGDNAGLEYFETNTDAGYQQISGYRPYESRSLEGRMQLQLQLVELGLNLHDPMAFLEEFTRFRLRTSNIPLEQILPAHELRAMLAAVFAWLLDNRPHQIEHLGQNPGRNVILPKETSR
jgi:hypothetical protein